MGGKSGEAVKVIDALCTAYYTYIKYIARLLFSVIHLMRMLFSERPAG